MSNQIKRYCVYVIIAIFFCFFCIPISYARIEFNWRECASAPGCTSTLTLQVTAPTLKTYIIESAGYFLNSHSSYQAFLNRIEMSETNGIDAGEFEDTIYSAIENMEKAKAAYANLKTVSEKTPYNQEMIDHLMIFDYDGFRVKYGLVEPIFEKVKTFLGKGDITGLDEAALANMDTILSKLYEIKSSVDKGLVPEIALLWRANQAYAEAQLFGQYVSEVFRDILF